MDYDAFLQTKLQYTQSAGLATYTLHEHLFPFQRHVTAWALERGRAALFLDTGLGKSACQLAWAQNIAEQQGDVLILAPLAVAQQTVAEGQRMDMHVTLCRDKADIRPGINIANYERLHRFSLDRFAGIVLDESSILKSYDGATRTQLITACSRVPYRLCCTATPSPNDHMELGNHAEFLGILSRNEMLATFFTHDGGDTSQWRLKRHAETAFWQWVASWAIVLTHPATMGDTTPGYDLPPLVRHPHLLTIDVASNGLTLFPMEARSLQEQRQAKRAGLAERVAAAVATIQAEPHEAWIVWCELNDEADALAKMLPGAVQIAGSDSLEAKEQRLIHFSTGQARILVTKPSIAGWGLNMQHCAHMVFVGINNSFESWYQAIRRCWRFGQTREVHVHLFLLDIEQGIMRNLERKEADAARMQTMMVASIMPHLHWQRPMQATRPVASMAIPPWLTTLDKEQLHATSI